MYGMFYFLLVSHNIQKMSKKHSYIRIGRRGLKNLTYPYMGVRWVKNCQNHPYIINEWPLRINRLPGDCKIFWSPKIDYRACAEGECRIITERTQYHSNPKILVQYSLNCYVGGCRLSLAKQNWKHLIPTRFRVI